ncbi:hypothetical protein BGZ49_006956 [Haplosporangium sp. Z 27]|nr:hypothetical protein BGZ49_006956 [Haplosporangium sp. Z 27]
MISPNTDNILGSSGTETQHDITGSSSPPLFPLSSPSPSPSSKSLPSPPTLFQRLRYKINFLYKSVSYSTKRRILRYIRLIILLLAFVGLILDAITLSFETNVMNLDWSQISSQAALLLAPDIFAMFLFFLLLIYSSETICCCYESPEEEEEYDDQYYDEQDQQAWSTSQQDHSVSNLHYIDSQQEQEYDEKNRKQELDEKEEEDDGEVLRRSKRNRVAFINDPEESAHLHQMSKNKVGATFVDTTLITPSTVTTPINTNGAATNNIPNTSSYHTRTKTHSPAVSIDVPTNPPTSSGEASRTISAINPTTTITSASSEVESALAMSPAEAENNTSDSPADSTPLPPRRRIFKYYATLRIILSLGLAALALYWPASQSKAPMGQVPKSGGPKNLEVGGDAYKFDSGNVNEPIFKRTTNNNTTGLGNYHRSGNYTRSRGQGPTPAGVSNGVGDDGWNYGSGFGWKHVCAFEHTFGDAQSASVYCRVKSIRPGITYGWAVLVIIELGVAAVVGDLSKSAGRLVMDEETLSEDYFDDENEQENNNADNNEGYEGDTAGVDNDYHQSHRSTTSRSIH